jgi:hypothetical protein
MKVIRSLALTTALVAAAATSATSQETAHEATQTVSAKVNQIHAITINGTPTLTISDAVAGQAPTPVTDNSTTYSITTNHGARDIRAHLEGEGLPTGVTLSIKATAPGKGSAATELQPLSTIPVTVVTGIENHNGSGSIEYKLEATSAAGTLDKPVYVVFTIVEGNGGVK